MQTLTNTKQSLLSSLKAKKVHASKMMGFCFDKYMESKGGEDYLEESDKHTVTFKTYHKAITRYMNNEFINKYSKFKELGKKPTVDFSSIPADDDWFADLPL